MCTFKTSPCVLAPTFWTDTRVRRRGRRGETGGGHGQFCLPKMAHVELSVGPRGSPKETKESYTKSLRTNREQHVPDSSNHSLYLMKLLTSTCPERNVGGNQLLDGSISLSPFLQLHRTICTSVLLRASAKVSLLTLPFSSIVHHLSGPDTLCPTQTTFKIAAQTHVHSHAHIHTHRNTYRYTQIHIYIYYLESSRTQPQLERKCEGANRPQHMHMYSHIVCD